jgi:hypothetical protein
VASGVLTEPTVQLKVAEPVAPPGSRAVTVTVEVAAAVGVPLIRPVPALMASAAGRPVALYVSTSPCGSVAWICRLVD